MNVSPGPLRIVDWWMAYLNYQVIENDNIEYIPYFSMIVTISLTYLPYQLTCLQIEHHLFPSMPQFR